MIHKNFWAITALVTGMSVVTGCATAPLVATDPRSISTTTKDQYIKRSLTITYMGDEFKKDHVSVDTYNHRVLLTGQASSYAQRNKIVKIASKTDGVNTVFDYLNVSSKYNSTTTEDTYITGKVKSLLFSTGDVNSNDVQVVTANGVVYLLGIIAKPQQKNMVEAARSVDGVRDVVPLLQYKSSDTKFNLPSSEKPSN